MIPLPSGARPTGLAAVYGSLWVASKGSHRLLRIDPATNRVVQTVDVGQESCGQPLEAYRDLLIMPCTGGTASVVVDGRSGAVRGAVPDAAGMTAASGAGSVWISNVAGTALKRIDPKTLQVQKEIRVASGMVSYDGYFVWSAGPDPRSHADGRLVKIDPRSNRVVARYRIPAMTGPFMTFAFGTLWFTPIDNAGLQRFDTATERTSRTRFDDWRPLTKVGHQPIATGVGSLWLRLRDGTVARIDPTTAQVTGRYPADPRGAGGHPLVAFNSLWIANYATDTIWRRPIKASG